MNEMCKQGLHYCPNCDRSIDIAPLEQRIKELEVENQRSKGLIKDLLDEISSQKSRIKKLEADALKASQECCRSAKAEMKEVIAGLVIKIEEQNGRIKELEAENQRLKILLDDAEELLGLEPDLIEVQERIESWVKEKEAQLERKGGDVE